MSSGGWLSSGIGAVRLFVGAHGSVEDVGEVAFETRKASGLLLPAAIRRAISAWAGP
jgi:hypothetical protein